MKDIIHQPSYEQGQNRIASLLTEYRPIQARIIRQVRPNPWQNTAGSKINRLSYHICIYYQEQCDRSKLPHDRVLRDPIYVVFLIISAYIIKNNTTGLN